MKKTRPYNKIFRLLIGRWLFLYLIIGAGLYGLIDHERVLYRTLDYLTADIVYLNGYAMGQQAYRQRRIRAAIRYYRHISRLFDSSPVALADTGWCYAHLNKTAEAQEMFLQAEAQENNLFGVNYNLGVLAFHQKAYGQALFFFQRALALQPVDIIQRGGRLSSLKQRDSHLIHYTDDVQLMVKQAYVDAYLYLLMIHAAEEDFTALSKAAQAGVTKAPLKQEAFVFVAGLAHFHLKEYQKALLFFKESLRLNPSFEEPRPYISEILLYQELQQGDIPVDKFSPPLEVLRSLKPYPERALFFYALDEGTLFKMKQKRR